MPLAASRLARFELRRFRGPLPTIALAFVLLIPLLYSAIYLTANWDPYGKLHNLPVALVNSDRPTTVGGKPIHAGADFVRNLHDQNAFHWIDTDRAEAERGLREGDYYLAVVVPPDFSTHLVSGQTDDPRRATIMLRRNDANGFVVGNITNSAQNSIARAVDESAETSYFNAVFANLAKIRSGLVASAQGSQRLQDGLVSATRGADRLDRGTSSAARGARTLSTGADSVSTGADRLSTGAGDLADGLKRAKKGSADLADGLHTLHRGSGDVADGADRVARGTQRLDDQVVPVLTAVQRVLPGIEDNAGRLSAGLTGISKAATAGSGSVSSDLTTADRALSQLRKDHPELADDPAFRTLSSRVSSASGHADEISAQVSTGAKRVARLSAAVKANRHLDRRVGTAKKNLVELNRGAHAVATGAHRVDRGVGKAAKGADTLATGISSASSGARRLGTGADSLSRGADRVATGADDLSDGLKTLHSGASSLDTGLGKLSAGATTLNAGLQKGARDIPTLTPDEQGKAVQVLSAPADVTSQVDNPATLYGRGLAPLFFSIALWVYGISVFLVVRPITGRALAGRASALRLSLTGWLPIGGIAVLAGWLMVGAVWLYPGLHPQHPVLIMALVTLGAVCFSSIAHLLRTALGTPGSSLLLVLLILQLTSAGGTYPGPLLPRFFQTIAPFLPMTYLINGFRVVISGGLMSHLVRDVVILGLVTVAALALCALVVHRRKQFSFTDLRPALTAP